MIYRNANRNDAENIAHLHAESWRNTYRGMLSDAYLDSVVATERLSHWQKRFTEPDSHQHIILALEADELLGFTCIYGDDDPKWGTMIDNLHIRPDKKGQGLGKKLLEMALEWSKENHPNRPIHLWVFEQNFAARGFYERMGGTNVERVLHHNEDDTEGYALRYAW